MGSEGCNGCFVRNWVDAGGLQCLISLSFDCLSARRRHCTIETRKLRR